MDSSCACYVSNGDIGRVLKSVTCFWPKSIPTMGHRPPSVSCRILCRSLNVLLCRCVRNLAVNLHFPRMCVLLRGEWHLVHMREGPNFLRHRWTWTPHMTYSVSRLARYGAFECACMMWSAPSSLSIYISIYPSIYLSIYLPIYNNNHNFYNNNNWFIQHPGKKYDKRN